MKALSILTIASAAVGSILLSSCYCPSEAKAPPLRSLPDFADIPVTPIEQSE